MADFLSNLWSSIFTPGPTPTLLIATNVSFAGLQLLLLALLIATYSIHFAILSVLCGGLWYAINWFAVELQAVQEGEQRAAAAATAEKEKEKEKEKVESRRANAGEGDADDEGEDTEVEESLGGGRGGLGRSTGSVRVEKVEEAAAVGSGASGATTGADARESAGKDARQRRVEDMDRSGEISTDSEWEKVSQHGS